MSAAHPAPLPEGLHRLLRAGLPVVLVTMGADGWGHTAMTWAVAVAPDRVRFGVDHGSTTLANLEHAGKAALQVIARDNTIALIKGQAKPVRPRIEAAPFAIAMWELVPTAVKDQGWAQVTVSPLAYAWTGPKAEALRRAEAAVLAELRDWPG
jgi:flavin reductase (DIM6/NTAB) family NADH-FMN oxidoreductase RutF